MRGLQMQFDGLHWEIGGFWRRLRIPKWRTRQDSNLWPLPSEGISIS
jgi:hypothetical protein